MVGGIPAPFIEELTPSPGNGPGILIENQFFMSLKGYFWALNDIPVGVCLF